MAHPVETITISRLQAFFLHYPFPLHVTVLSVSVLVNSAHESISPHTILAFIIPTLLGFFQIQSAGTDEPSSLQAQPMTTVVSVFSIISYYLAFAARLRLSAYASQLGIAMAIFGSVSVASLVSLLLSDSWWPARYIFCLLVLVAELHPFLKTIYDICGHHFWGFIAWQPWCTRTAMRPLLPLNCMDEQADNQLVIDLQGYLY